MLSFYDTNTKIRVVSVINKGNYSQIKGKTGRKDKQTGEWHNSTWNFVNFLGDAHKNIAKLEEALENTEKFENGDSKDGVWIVLRSVGLENAPWVDSSGTTRYPKNYKISVFAWKFPDDDSQNLDKPPIVDSDEDDADDDEFPFF